MSCQNDTGGDFSFMYVDRSLNDSFLNLSVVDEVVASDNVFDNRVHSRMCVPARTRERHTWPHKLAGGPEWLFTHRHRWLLH